jgi:glycosyltransferase involved in cell wall biosynthesis
MRPHPAISIVTPSFNQAPFLEETIDSVLSQGYPNLEYVIIDGGSTDGSVEIIRKHERHLAYWVSEKDRGHADAINKGFARTSGELMAWVNSDDKYLPWTFRVVADVFEQFPEISWIVGYNAGWSSTGFLTTAYRNPKNIYDYLLGHHEWIQQESTFWRRSLWDKAGAHLDTGYRFMVDGELWSRFFLHAELYTVDCILGGYRFHGTNRARENWSTVQEEMRRAIAAMKARCSPEVLETLSVLERLSKLTHAPVLSHFPLAGAARKVMPQVFDTVAYRNLTFEDDQWRLRRLPFSP